MSTPATRCLACSPRRDRAVIAAFAYPAIAWTTPRSAPLSSKSEMKLRLGHVMTGPACRQARLLRRRRGRPRRPLLRGADPLGLRARQAGPPRQRDQPGARAVEAGAPRVLPEDGDRVSGTAGNFSTSLTVTTRRPTARRRQSGTRSPVDRPEGRWNACASLASKTRYFLYSNTHAKTLAAEFAPVGFRQTFWLSIGFVCELPSPFAHKVNLRVLPSAVTFRTPLLP